MSHISTIKAKIKDLSALENAVHECGGKLVRGQKAFRHYSSTPGKCDHVIRVTNVNYEVGVVSSGKGEFELQYDPFTSGSQHDGKKLEEKFGVGLKKLIQLQAVHTAAMAARKKGWSVSRRTLKDGTIQLVASV